MARLGYLFLVAVLGFTILGPSMASADEGRGLKQYAQQRADKPTKHAPIRYGDDRRHHQHPQQWDNRRHNRHWRHRHYVRRPPVRRHFFVPPPPVRHYGHGTRYQNPPRYYSNDAGTIDFNINYRLFF